MPCLKEILRAQRFVASVLSIVILLIAGSAELDRLSMEQIGTGLGALAREGAGAQPSGGQAPPQPSGETQSSGGVQPSGSQPISGTPAGGSGGAIIPGVGTGGTFKGQHLTDVTGGGTFPDISKGVTANCTGDGNADDTQCLQYAMDQACSANVPLLIPYKMPSYMISNPIKICGSVIGTGGMPKITQTNNSGSEDGVGLDLQSGMTGWIYNLHIVGTYNGSRRDAAEWAHNVSVGPVNGVTIKGNILEKASGANIGDGAKSPPARNVLVDNNTMLDPWQCNIALVDQSDRWVITNNYLLYKSGYVTPVDYEPWQESSYVTNIEFAYNKVDCQKVGFKSCMQISAWFDQTPGENIYTHHNYGTWVAQFPSDYGYRGSGVHFGNVVTTNNAQGGAPPSP